MGMHYVAYGPKELWPEESILKKVQEVAKESGAIIEVSDNIESLKGADVIYTDVWVSMGEEDQMENRVKLLSNFRVDMDMLKATENPDVIFMHCLPAFHDFETEVAKEAKERGLDIREVTDEVFRSKHSVVFDEAENRMHTIKAVMVATL
jgi:ornithine carbamoyltransferase